MAKNIVSKCMWLRRVRVSMILVLCFILPACITIGESDILFADEDFELALNEKITPKEGEVIDRKDPYFFWKNLNLDYQAGEVPSAVGPIRYVIAQDKRTANAPVFISCGGAGFKMRLHDQLSFRKLGLYGGVLLFDYPGFDDDRVASVAGIKASADAIADLVDEGLPVDPDRPIIAWGHSLGGFVCADIATKSERIDGLVLESSMPRAEAAAEYLVPGWMRVKIDDSIASYDLPDILKAYDKPIMVLHATNDRYMPVQLGRQLARELDQNLNDVRYYEASSGGHYFIALTRDFFFVMAEFLQWNGWWTEDTYQQVEKEPVDEREAIAVQSDQ